LYAEGDRDFADFLISFLTFPLGGVVRMFGGNCSLGSVDALYNSILDLDENKYFVTKFYQFVSHVRSFTVMTHDDYYITCENVYYFDDIPDTKTVFVERSCDTFVKGPRTYVATDDLVVTESSPTTVSNLINHFQTSLDDLKEKVTNIGAKEVCKIYSYIHLIISVTCFCCV
jgi:hypothetical protein